MGGRSVLLVSAALGACVPDLPRGIHVESRFSPDEVALIDEAIDNANQRFGPLIGHDVLVDLGTYDDPDGFQFDDFGDDVSAIYAVDRASPEYQWLAGITDEDLGGYGTLGDVLLFERLPARPSDADRAAFRELAMHELGHFLGLLHTANPDAVMYPVESVPLDTYTTVDQQLFCLQYGC